MLSITIERDNYAYLDTENNTKLFELLKKSFTRTTKEYNNYYKMYDTIDKKMYSIINKGTIIKVKAGLVPFLCNSLYVRKIKYNIIDKRLKIRKDINVITKLNEKVTLFDYQEQAVKNVFNKNPFTCIQLPTGTGKTEIAASIIKTYLHYYPEEAALFAVPTKTLQSDSCNRFKEYGIKVNTKLPLQVGAVNVLTFKLLTNIYNDSYRLDYKQRDLIGAICWDEAHHLSADVLSRVVHRFQNLRLNVGLSATPSNDLEKKKFLNELNIKEFSVYGCTGKPIYRMEIKDSIDNNFVVPIEIRVFKCRSKHFLGDDEYDWNIIRNVILKDRDRAIKIAKYTKHIFDEANLNTIVLLIPEVEWSKIYMNEIAEIFKDNKEVRLFQWYGGDVILEYKNGEYVTLNDTQKQEAVSAIKNPDVKTIFSATSFFFEGANITNIQAVINCYGGKDSKRVKQQAGRAMRCFKNKNVAYIHEILDANNPVLESQFEKRIKIYTQEYNAKVIYSSFTGND